CGVRTGGRRTAPSPGCRSGASCRTSPTWRGSSASSAWWLRGCVRRRSLRLLVAVAGAGCGVVVDGAACGAGAGVVVGRRGTSRCGGSRCGLLVREGPQVVDDGQGVVLGQLRPGRVVRPEPVVDPGELLLLPDALLREHGEQPLAGLVGERCRAGLRWRRLGLRRGLPPLPLLRLLRGRQGAVVVVVRDDPGHDPEQVAAHVRDRGPHLLRVAVGDRQGTLTGLARGVGEDADDLVPAALDVAGGPGEREAVL